ncbi:Protein CBG17101 [Caenorhabditis briggsae]|uniref:Protein CBG17101 n=1 Tax=Caenorhabditis briggsae TaxID=6238 RepID=A8XQD7_CAEBR|nr:Protein CBG17101 [Caenorhabditis briggsae]CAP34863.2 Protein CBG17101 [Caenorhabditis briggsae]
MNKIAKKFEADGYTFLKKVHLVFIFSWLFSDEFVKIVHLAKCTVQLDEKERIKYFCSEDGSVVLSSDHKEEEKFFKGTVFTPKRAVRPSQPTDPGPAKNSNVKLENPGSEESESEHEAPTNVSDDRNSEYSRIQNGPFNGRINYDELDEQEFDDVTTLNVTDFNSFIDSMLKSIKRSKNRYYSQTEDSLPIKTIYRHIKLSLILPFGLEVTGEALKIVEKEIEELRESQDEVPLKTIRGNLEYLLNSSTGFWI